MSLRFDVRGFQNVPFFQTAFLTVVNEFVSTTAVGMKQSIRPLTLEILCEEQHSITDPVNLNTSTTFCLLLQNSIPLDRQGIVVYVPNSTLYLPYIVLYFWPRLSKGSGQK